MPMSFPNLDSLMRRAEQRGFRQPVADESEDSYRSAFADFMVNVDRVESAEIRSGKGWDQMAPQELLADLLSGKNRGMSTSARSQTQHITHIDDCPFYPHENPDGASNG